MVKTTGRWKSEGKLSEWLRDNARPTDRLIPRRLVKGCRAGRFVGDERGENIELPAGSVRLIPFRPTGCYAAMGGKRVSDRWSPFPKRSEVLW